MSNAWKRWKKKILDRDHLMLMWGLLLFILCLQYFFDNKNSDSHKGSEADKIGNVTLKSGDVRLKSSDAVYWQTAETQTPLYFNDAIYTGANSSTELKIGSSTVKINPNSMIVLRKFRDKEAFEISFGAAAAEVKAGQKMMVLVPGQAPVELSSEKGAKVSISRGANGVPIVQNISGESQVKIGEKKQRLGEMQSSNLAKTEESDNDFYQFQKLGPEEEIYANSPQDVKFSWVAKENLGNLKGQYFETSDVASFTRVTSSENVVHQSGFDMSFKKDSHLFYRLRDSSGRRSPVHKLSFVRMQKPSLHLSPPEDKGPQEFEDPQHPLMTIEIDRESRTQDAWLQVATDSEFQQIVLSERTAEHTWKKNIPPGQYFVRARSTYPRDNFSEWTASQRFQIKAPILLKPSWPLSLSKKIWIDTTHYSNAWLKLSKPKLQEKLQSHVDLKKYFANLLPQEPEDVKFEVESTLEKKTMTVTSSRFPASWITPGSQAMRFRKVKAGTPGSWSPNQDVEIIVAAPKWQEQTSPDQSQNFEPELKVVAGWSPIFFANKYEIEGWSSESPRSRESQTIAQTSVVVTVKRGTARGLRVRGLSADGKPVSPWSELMNIAAPEPTLAERSPAQENVIAGNLEKGDVQKFPKDFWVWFGSGITFANYQQSSATSQSAQSSQLTGPAVFAEVGEVGPQGWGMMGSYRQTPGSVGLADANVDQRNYFWTTLSAEAVKREETVHDVLGGDLSYSGLAGIHFHSIPYAQPLSGNRFTLRRNSLMTGSIGVKSELRRGKWRYDGMLRYQHPLRSSGSDFDFAVTPSSAIDGAVGASYQMMTQWRVGAFLQSQMYNFKYSYTEGSTTNSGAQSLQHSNVDLRLGYEF